MKRLALSAFALLLVSAPTVYAQPLAPIPFTGANTNGGPPPVTWMKLDQTGDTRTSSDQQSDAIDDLAIVPLRLSLMGEFTPHSSNDPLCSSSPESSGSLTGMPSFPAQQTTGIRVLGSSSSALFRSRRNGPRLSLFGMSRLGCGLDSLAGGGATFTLPLGEKTFFVLSGGAIYLPHGGPNGVHAQSGQARADIVFAREGGRAYTVGVGVIRGSPRVSVGGAF